MADHSKLVIIVTHGPQDPELATIPFVIGVRCACVRRGDRHGFQADGVCLMHEGEASTVQAPELAPLAKLISDFQELGGSLLVCLPCIKSRGITDTLIPGTEVVAAARLVAEVTSATSTLATD